MDGKFETVIDLTDKNFYRTLCAWLVGESFNVKLKGSRQQVDTLLEAYEATTRFNESLRTADVRLDRVLRLLGEKHVSADKFEKLFDVAWPL